MSKYPKHFLSHAFAQDGDYVIPPSTAVEAGAGRLSQNEGFGKLNETPLENGGIAPFREDMNGALFLMSGLLVWYQQGGLVNYSASVDYEPGNEILMNGTKFRCLQANGPASTKVVPGSNAKYWRNVDNPVPAGCVTPFYNVTLGGTDSRRPIFWGKTEPDESWVLCDGGSDGKGGTVPDMTDRFIMGTKTTTTAGQTGGQSNFRLMMENIPAHTHQITLSENGAHNHNRGSMNITGEFGAGGQERNTHCTGSFYDTGRNQNVADSGNTSSKILGFDASRTWTGSTSTNGGHRHDVTCSTVGGSGGSAREVSTLPPYIKMAYFIKLPE